MKRPLMVLFVVVIVAWQSLAEPQAPDRERGSEGFKAIPTSDLAKTAPPQAVEPCLKEARRHDFDVDEKEAPLAQLKEWLETSEATQIPWKVQVKNPELRIDQRYEVSYSVTVQGKDLESSTSKQELFYVSGVMESENQPILQSRWSRQTFESGGANFAFRFTDCVFLQPGNYLVWTAVYDPKTARHSIAKKRVRAPEFSSDPLPKANAQAPSAEFPDVNGSPSAAETLGPIFLPIANRQPFAVEFISTLSPLDQWNGRDDIARAINNHVLSAIGVFSQLQLASGSASVRVLDPVNRTIAFQQDDFKELDWGGLSAKYTDARSLHTVTLPALQSAGLRSAFIVDSLRQGLGDSSDPLRVIILISGSLLFERGYDSSSLKWEADCNCKAYHLRFQVSKDDVFDDLGKAIKPLRPKTFDIVTAQEFRKALGAIVQDLNRL
jgi:hypothetical protein